MNWQPVIQIDGFREKHQINRRVILPMLTALIALLRPSELVLLCYLVYATGVGLARPISSSIQLTAVAINCSIVTLYCFLAWVDSFRRTEWMSTVRDWIPLAFMLLGYREMGWFALPHASTALEQAWVRWDRLLLNHWGLRAIVESAGAVGPSVLEIAYALVYAMAPLSLAALYLTGNRRKADQFLFLFLLAVLSADALFPYFPSEPPRTVFPLADLPPVITVFRRFNLWYLGDLGIHMSVFPSGHVAGSSAAAIALMRLIRKPKWIGRAMLALAVLIATATVYCRYHYLVDALAGFSLSLIAWGVTAWLYRRAAR